MRGKGGAIHSFMCETLTSVFEIQGQTGDHSELISNRGFGMKWIWLVPLFLPGVTLGRRPSLPSLHFCKMGIKCFCLATVLGEN